MTRKVANDLVAREAELIESGLALQAQGLDLLRAEMQALASLMSMTVLPGAAVDARSEAEIEAETEAGFDNMPV